MTETYLGNCPTYSSQDERNARAKIIDLFKNSPIPEGEILYNLPLFINRQQLSRIFQLKHLYEQILDVHGVIMEFGVRWGQNLALFTSLRGMLEPFNISREITGFDTFEGFKNLNPEDTTFIKHEEGDLHLPSGYEHTLAKILAYQEQECPNSHIKKHEIIKGDAIEEVPKYLKSNPQTIISMAYFDMDVYKPTLEVLKSILPYCTKGTLLGFDELNCKIFPGETVALREILGTKDINIKRTPLDPLSAYIIL